MAGMHEANPRGFEARGRSLLGGGRPEESTGSTPESAIHWLAGGVSPGRLQNAPYLNWHEKNTKMQNVHHWLDLSL